MDLKSKLLDPAQTVLLYGTTPPRLGTPEEQVSAAGAKLAARIAALPLDGVVVYDIQDETGRTQLPRPFPFMRTIDPRQYSMQLMQSTGLPAITYKALGNLDESGWRAWLSESQRIGFISVVGRPTSGVRYPLPLSKAIRTAATHPAGFTIGGVVIAERHTVRRSGCCPISCATAAARAASRAAWCSPSRPAGARRRSPSCAGSASTSPPTP